jgi:hypothetical protein
MCRFFFGPVSRLAVGLFFGNRFRFQDGKEHWLDLDIVLIVLTALGTVAVVFIAS